MNSLNVSFFLFLKTNYSINLYLKCFTLYIGIAVISNFVFLIDPACQNINTEFHCYIADPFCPIIPRKKESFNYIAIILTLVGCLILVVAIVIGIIVCCLWRRKSKNLKQIQLLDICTSFLLYF